MLGRQFLKIDNVILPRTTGFDFELEAVESVSQSEAGTDLVVTTRLDKHIFKADWTVSSFWLDKFEAICKEKTVVVPYKDVDYTCRARGFAPQLIEDSENIEGTDGLWKISLTLTEV